VTSDFVDAVARFIGRHQLLPDDAPVLVGVSGGPDSMVCLAVLRELEYDVHALHVNYGLREGADADEALVREWCAGQSPSVPLRVEHLDATARAESHDESLQEAARVLRYEALADHAAEIEAAAVAVGHHRDDQAETLLLNLLRGAGPEGMAGMPPSRPLREEPSVWRRRLILAALEQTLPEAPQTAAFAREVADLIDAQVGRRVEATGGTIWRERDELRFFPAEAVPENVWPPIPVPWGEEVPLPGGVLCIDPLDARPESLDAGTPYVEYVDAGCLVDPLDIHTWREGDRFQPLGLDGTKLVSDLLTDADVPSHQRSGTYVLSTDEHVAWVVGHRLDHRVRVRPSTEQVARLSWKPSESGESRENTSDDCNSA